MLLCLFEFIVMLLVRLLQMIDFDPSGISPIVMASCWARVMER